MLTRPKFHPHFHVEVVSGEGVFLISDSRQTLLKGKIYEQLADLLDGRPVDQICASLKDQASPAEIFFAIHQMEKKNYLCESHPDDLPAGQASLWASLQVSPAEAMDKLARQPVAVRGLGVDVGPLRQILQELRVRIEANAPAEVVVVDSLVRKELASINQDNLRQRRPWLLVKPTGRQLIVGPLLVPGKTACWECLASRIHANSPVTAYLQDKSRGGTAVIHDRAVTPATLQIAFGLAANTIATWIVQGEIQQLLGELQSLDVPTWQMRNHRLVQLPFCQACGLNHSNGGSAFVVPNLQSRLKTTSRDGGHRVVNPEETLRKYGHHVSPITGAVPLLEKSGPDSDGVLHVYIAGNNMARSHQNIRELRGSLRSMSGGKGASDSQARASGLCEGLERYSGVFRGNEPRRWATQADLGSAAIPLADCLQFSERQYADREARNAIASRFNFIPVPFDSQARIEWSPVWSLTHQQVRYLPTAFCYYNYPQPEETTYCLACSNGNAAGNTLEEATLQGFLELVERDSVALWWYNRIRRPAVDLASFQDPYLDRVAQFLKGHGRDFWVLDLTADLGIPVFASVCRRTNGPPEQIVFGFGAHLEPRVALIRAVTEMNQMLSCPLLEPEGKETGDTQADPETAHWLQNATISNQPYLMPLGTRLTTAQSFSPIWTEDVAEDVRSCQRLVQKVGMEMLLLDQTRSEIGLPVVKVIVPGLRHFWPRFAPGRLYDVPVRLKWLPQPRTEDELNPIAMFL